MQGFDSYLDSLSHPKSFVSASVGIGNRSFSLKNNALNSQESTTRQLSLTPSLGYYHKSGLGLTATAYAAQLNSRFLFYQYALTPSYDYINPTFSAGLSYTRYFGKDTSALTTSPYDHDLYAYLSFKRHNWRYGLAAGYAAGSFNDKLTYADSLLRFNTVLQKYQWVHYNKTVESYNHLKDFSLSASVRRDFHWDHIFDKDDDLSLNLTAYLMAGSSHINTDTHIDFSKKHLALGKFKRSYQNADGNAFQIQSTAFSAGLYYAIGNINIMPTWFIDYYFQESTQKFTQVFSFTLAYDF